MPYGGSSYGGYPYGGEPAGGSPPAGVSWIPFAVRSARRLTPSRARVVPKMPALAGSQPAQTWVPQAPPASSRRLRRLVRRLTAQGPVFAPSAPRLWVPQPASRRRAEIRVRLRSGVRLVLAPFVPPTTSQPGCLEISDTPDTVLGISDLPDTALVLSDLPDTTVAISDVADTVLVMSDVADTTLTISDEACP